MLVKDVERGGASEGVEWDDALWRVASLFTREEAAGLLYMFVSFFKFVAIFEKDGIGSAPCANARCAALCETLRFSAHSLAFDNLHIMCKTYWEMVSQVPVLQELVSASGSPAEAAGHAERTEVELQGGRSYGGWPLLSAVRRAPCSKTSSYSAFKMYCNI